MHFCFWPTRHIAISGGIVGRIQPDDVLSPWERPWLGFYYGCWLPRFQLENRANVVPDLSVTWLCFWLTIRCWKQFNGH